MATLDIRRSRLDSLDIMRAIAVAAMVACHGIIYWSSDDSFAATHFLGDHVLGVIAAPLFLFLVGVSRALAGARPHQAGSCEERAEARRAMVRGVLIFVVGVASSFLVWTDPLGDVLPLIGFSVVTLTILRHRSPLALASLAVVMVLLAPSLRALSGYAELWGGFDNVPLTGDSLPGMFMQAGNEGPSYAGGASATALLFLCNGYFPLFPWLAFPLVGLAIGKLEFATAPRARSRTLLLSAALVLAVAGTAVAIACAAPAADVATDLLAPLAFYPETISLLGVQLGLVLLLFCWLRHRDTAVTSAAEETEAPPWLAVCRRLSRYALTIYVLHQVFIFWPLWVAGAVAGDMEKYSGSAVSPPIALGLSIALLVVLHQIARRWDRVQGKPSIEWMLERALSHLIRVR